MCTVQSRESSQKYYYCDFQSGSPKIGPNFIRTQTKCIDWFRTTKETKQINFEKKKKPNQFYLLYLRHKSTKLKKSARRFQDRTIFHPGHSQPD